MKRFVILLALFMGGCTGTSGLTAVGTLSVAQGGDPQWSTRVEADNSALARTLAIEHIDTLVSGNSLIKPQVVLRSLSSSTQKLVYKFRWFNDTGTQVERDSSIWQPLLVYGRESVTVQGVAPNSSASTFRLTLRTAQ